MGEKLKAIEPQDIKVVVKLSFITALIMLIIGEINLFL